jgi:antitoxin ParD1/3/4
MKDAHLMALKFAKNCFALLIVRIYLTFFIKITDQEISMAQVRTQTVSLGEHWNNLIESLLNSGRYASVSEIMRDSLRLLEEREANSKLHFLRTALIDGEESGDAGELNMETLRLEAKKEAGLV